ncbi:hypothetical protein MPTK1_7g03180 [Marchantia polymorpha subsp. ruderalis]|uniref:J domain-containing protein n=2 Tax=Marchantia polymorpha TaxID=3197 RepID=A0A176WE65_MARPO|nr:hypothetical protein AXG93_3016s1360 [Marchantia polymorpha subsp. ruderalis]PTQ35105.1 hypothetical protein MARPO_0074s0078 [Marchantia polymorpha]PTQ35106.1 hypothetical protein MARPO_0074s0078 [Marchantia polymorpha]BBN16059.1 hypothetical protein Mp_7g03180 [Marchantia polymorpha subsp. ruderalis]BBN16060.1 hypothetical protein Mp_7g03180 [Marchantia polymorpha subsp. ruderalis]|eukprot:PTQ35105.1 hypothetical protein MARPO_0074s0078 [Marchantia polymorpha]
MELGVGIGGSGIRATQCAADVSRNLPIYPSICCGGYQGRSIDAESLSSSSGLFSFRLSAQNQKLHSDVPLTRRPLCVSCSQFSFQPDGSGMSTKFEPFSEPFGKNRCVGSGISHNRRFGWKGFLCRAYEGSTVGDLEWMSTASPHEVLGISEDCSEEEIKSAFRARIKEYHPDVYQGFGDADAITQRLLRAYEILTTDVGRQTYKRKSLDPFEEPECFAEDLFVNEVACIGRGCPYSCVERAPDVFQYAPDTGCARAVKQGKGDEYHVQLAVGQCPRNCIHYLTPEQRIIVEELLRSAIEGTVYSYDTVTMEGLIAKANYENGRYQPPKRTAKRTEQWVDWF